MNIIEMTAGAKIPWQEEAGILSLNNDELVIDLNARQADVQAVIDICVTGAGKLVEGYGEAYAVNILIPPRRYTEREEPGTDMNGDPTINIVKESLPLDVKAVTLQLWGMTATDSHDRQKP